jgi:hypothetical protein
VLVQRHALSERGDDLYETPPVAVKARQSIDPRVARARRLLADDISLERASGEIHAERLCGRAATSTVETLMFSLRAGVTALGKPDTLRRLSELSDTQLRDVAVRLQKFTAEIARPWPPEDIEVLLATRSKIRGQDA